VHGVGLREVVIDAVEEVFFVALVVEDGELGRVEKAAQASSRKIPAMRSALKTP